eukprot:225719_1
MNSSTQTNTRSDHSGNFHSNRVNGNPLRNPQITQYQAQPQYHAQPQRPHYHAQPPRSNANCRMCAALLITIREQQALIQQLLTAARAQRQQSQRFMNQNGPSNSPPYAAILHSLNHHGQRIATQANVANPTSSPILNQLTRYQIANRNSNQTTNIQSNASSSNY